MYMCVCDCVCVRMLCVHDDQGCKVACLAKVLFKISIDLKKKRREKSQHYCGSHIVIRYDLQIYRYTFAKKCGFI